MENNTSTTNYLYLTFNTNSKQFTLYNHSTSTHIHSNPNQTLTSFLHSSNITHTKHIITLSNSLHPIFFSNKNSQLQSLLKSYKFFTHISKHTLQLNRLQHFSSSDHLKHHKSFSQLTFQFPTEITLSNSIYDSPFFSPT